MRKTVIVLLLIVHAIQSPARSVVYAPQVKTLQVVANEDWLSPPVMRLGSSDVLNIGFDELSHTYHRYVYKLAHCEADWSPSEDLFESDWLEGFNGNTIDNYENSLNTTVAYTHYRLQIPNDHCRLKISGNYRLHVYDEDDGDREVLCAEFYVVEPLMRVGLSVTSNTEKDFNLSHQQVSMEIVYAGVSITNEEEQIRTVIMQNQRQDNQKVNPRPNIIKSDGMIWEHNAELIFDAGNEYHKYEILDVSHATMGIDHIMWDGQHYHAYPFSCTPLRNYLYDQDANGAFYIRNSDNIENDRTCDYVYVHYKLMPSEQYADNIVVDGNWTTEATTDYTMEYDEQEHSYNHCLLQKQGYYSYQYVLHNEQGQAAVMPEEGSFYQTENRYQAFVYYKGVSERTWRLAGYQQVTIR